MSDYSLATHGLKASYGDAQVLFGIDWEINTGEVIGVLGANGAGKSTFLKTITGFLSCPDAQVTLNGKNIGHLSAGDIVKLGITMVPEGRRLFPSMTVKENLQVGAFSKRRGRWNLESVYRLFPILKEKRDAPSTSLSGGQQQMVAIGRALMSNPRILLCDEISLGLAPVIVKDIYDKLPELTADGMSIVVVEQDVGLAQQCSDRLYCFQEGRIALAGASSTLTRDKITQAYFGI